MGTRGSLAKLSRELYPGLDAIDQNLVSLDNANTFSNSQTGGQARPISGSLAIAAAMNLEANRRYHVTDTDGATYQLPHSSGSLNTGDVIEVFYNAILGDREVHKFAAGGGELFAPSSNVYKSGNAAAGNVFALVAKPDGDSNDFLNLTGASNGGIGIGTYLKCLFDGAKWHVEGHIMNSGNGGVAVTAAFADS